MVGIKTGIVILLAIAMVGIAASIPSGLTSLGLSVIAVVAAGGLIVKSVIT